MKSRNADTQFITAENVSPKLRNKKKKPNVIPDLSEVIRDSARLTAVWRTGLLDTPAEEGFDRLARLAAKTLAAPIALISLLDADRLFFKSRVGVPAETPLELPLTQSFCQYNVTLNQPLVINDALDHALVCKHPAVAAFAMRGYLGAPLVTQDGHGVGVLCVIDSEPRVWTGEQIAILTDLAGAVVTEIELRMAAHQAKASLIELEHTQQALQKNEERFRAAFARAAVGMTMVTVEGRFLQANQAFCDITGYTETELSGLDFTAITHPDDRASNMDSVQRLLAGEIPAFVMEKRYIKKDGPVVWVQTSASLIRDSQGQPASIIALTYEITARKRAEQEREQSLRREREQRTLLEQQNAQLDAIIRNMPDAIYIGTATGIHIANEPALTLLGFQSLEELDQNISDLAEQIQCRHPETQELIAVEDLPFSRALRGERNVGEVVIRHLLTGKDRTMRCAAAPIIIGGQTVAAIAVNTDVTEQKQADHDLRESNRRLTLLSQTANQLLLEDDSRVFIKTLYEKLSGQLDLEVYFNYLVTDDGSRLRLNCCAGIPSTLVSQIQTLEFGYGLCGWVAQHRRPLTLQNIQASEDINSQLLRSLGIKAYACHPLIAQNEFIGTLAFGSSKRSVFSLDELEVIGAVCNQVAAALQRKRADEKLHHSEERYRALYEDNPSMYFTLTTEGVILSVNRFGSEHLGFSKEEMIGQSVLMLVHDNDKQHIEEQFRAYVANPADITHWEFRKVRKDGSVIWVREAVRCVQNPDGDTVVLVVCDDITDRKHIEEQLRHSAFHDALTGLANQARFRGLLARAITNVKRHQDRLFGVLFIDLDRFKVINDSLGHIVGDQLLVVIAQRLETCVRPGDSVARFGGDEFTVLLEDIKDTSEAVYVANRIHKAFHKPFHLPGGHEIHTSASIGIALSTPELEKSEDILRDADNAMYRAKAHGKGRYQVFEDRMYAHALKKWELEGDLRRALECDELHVHYQPIVCMRSGKIRGLEALARWEHPQRGLLYPEDFIPLAEETGLIGLVGAKLLGLGCAQLKAWQRAGFPYLQLSVNFSALQFQDLHLAELIEKVLEETGLSPESLKLEITESLAMKNTDYSIAILNQLSAMGVQISIDDFGTGYSSLAYLRRFPIDTVKIDQSFVRDITHDADDAAISAAIIAMAHSLKLDVVAEGVETEEQLALLRTQHCDSMQGFLFSRPLTAQVFTRLLQEDRGLPPHGKKEDSGTRPGLVS